MYKHYAALIQEKGISSYTVSKATGIPIATLRSWKTRGTQIHPKTARKLSNYFGLPMNFFIEDDMNKVEVEIDGKKMIFDETLEALVPANRATSESYRRYYALVKQMGLTSYKVSKATGVSQQTLSSWKNGSQISLQTALKLSKFFGVPLDYFADNSEKEPEPEKQAPRIDEDLRNEIRSIIAEELKNILSAINKGD